MGAFVVVKSVKLVFKGRHWCIYGVLEKALRGTGY